MVDEFRSDELSSRCSKNLIICADDPQKVENVVKELFPEALCTRTPENHIRIKGHIEEAGLINQVLNKIDVIVHALMPEGENLEDHFLSLMGGNTNV